MTDAPGPGVVVVPMTAEHWPAVHLIYATGIATGHATFESEPPATWAAFDAAKVPGLRLVATDAHGEVLGWAAASPVSERCVYAGVVEHSVYVAPEARGHGVGRALVVALLDEAHAAGVWTVQSGVFPENTASLALHSGLGFRTVGVRERLGRMTHGPLAGRWRDVVLLEHRRTED